MGKARDGSECYTRQNKAGGSYVTCEGSQQARQRFAGELRGLLSVGDKPKPKPKVDWGRSDTVRGRSRRAAKARRLTTRPEGRIETGSINTGSVITDFDMSSFVQERPGVVGMTTNMSGIELATYDALFGAGSDVAKGISAAVAARDPKKKFILRDQGGALYEGRFSEYGFQVEDVDTFTDEVETMSAMMTQSEADRFNREIIGGDFPAFLYEDGKYQEYKQQEELRNFGGAAEPEPQPVSVYQQRLKERGLDTDISGNEARLMSEFKNEPSFISGSDDEFIEQILQAVGWSPDFAPLSAAQRKRLLSTRGKNNMFIKPNRGMGGVDQKNTRMIEIGEFSEGVRGRVVFKFLPKIRLKYLGK